MGKSGKFGNLTLHARASTRGGTDQRCINCGVRIFYGERCETHKRELLQRRRRKLR